MTSQTNVRMLTFELGVPLSFEELPVEMKTFKCHACDVACVSDIIVLDVGHFKNNKCLSFGS